MTQLSGVSRTTSSPEPPQPVAAPLASLADRPFAYVLRGLVEAQLARADAAPPSGNAASAGNAVPVYAAVTVGPHGPTTIGAFTLRERVLASTAG
jgi:hypothetical protein